MRQRVQGVVLWEGQSVLAPTVPIVAIATGFIAPSVNAKTGPAIQVYVMRSDMEPHEAVKGGWDHAVCGDCYHRGDTGRRRSCYVVMHQGPLVVYRAWKRGLYPAIENILVDDNVPSGTVYDDDGVTVGSDQWVRMTAYGDPAAVPKDAWVMSLGNGPAYGDPLVRGFTSQWRKVPTGRLGASWFRRTLMASCMSEQDVREAREAGWSTFRALRPGEGLLPGEGLCAAETHGVQCTQCRGCRGRASRPRAIPAHGYGKNNY